jgi:hypothetical protein
MKSINVYDKGRQMEKVMKQAIAEEIERRRKLGHNIAIWKDGKVVVGKVEELAPSKSRNKFGTSSSS